MKAARRRIGRRCGIVLGMTALASAGLAAPALAIKSVQKFALSAQPATATATANPAAKIGTGTAFAKGLGLDESLALQVFSSPGGPTLLVTGQSPLIIHEIAPGTLTSLAGDPAFSYRLTFSFPRNVQSPAPGVLAALTDLQLAIPAQVAAIGNLQVPLFATVGCSGTQSARYSADYATGFDGAIESSQTVDTAQPCPASSGGAAVTISIHSWFDDISADLADERQFAPVNVNVYLPKDVATNLSQFPTCSAATILSDEKTCPGGPPAVVGTPQVTPTPAPTSKVSLTRPARGRLFSKQGTTTVTATLNGAGRITVVLRTRTGKQTLVVAKGAAIAKQAGKLKVRLTLTRRGRVLVREAGAQGVRVSLTATGTVSGGKPATTVLNRLRLRG